MSQGGSRKRGREELASGGKRSAHETVGSNNDGCEMDELPNVQQVETKECTMTLPAEGPATKTWRRVNGKGRRTSDRRYVSRCSDI